MPELAVTVSAALSKHPVYALDADLEARGVKAVIDGIQVIGFDGFVELVGGQVELSRFADVALLDQQGRAVGHAEVHALDDVPVTGGTGPR